MSSMQLSNQRAMGNLMSIKKRKEAIEIEQENEVVKESNLMEVKGIGDATIKILFDNGITTKEELISCSIDKIKSIIKSPLTYKNIESFIKENTN